jgi:tetratricopeptide (TPR) repeat protein
VGSRGPRLGPLWRRPGGRRFGWMTRHLGLRLLLVIGAMQTSVSRHGCEHALGMPGAGNGRPCDRCAAGERRRATERGLDVCQERGGADFPAGNADEVEQELRRRLHDNELDLAAALYLGDVLHLVRSDADAAAACFEHVLETDTRNVHAMGSYALVLLRERSDYERASLMLSRVLARDPHHTRALELSAWLECFVRRRAPEARRLCQRALHAPTSTKSPRTVSVSLLRLYASVLARQGQRMCAATVLEVALQLDPYDLWTVRRLAQVLQDRDAGVAALLLLHARRLEGEQHFGGVEDTQHSGGVEDTLGAPTMLHEQDVDWMQSCHRLRWAPGRTRADVGAATAEEDECSEEAEEDESSQVPGTAVHVPARVRASAAPTQHRPDATGELRGRRWRFDRAGGRRCSAWKTLFDQAPAGRQELLLYDGREARELGRGLATSPCQLLQGSLVAIALCVPSDHDPCTVQVLLSRVCGRAGTGWMGVLCGPVWHGFVHAQQHATNTCTTSHKPVHTMRQTLAQQLACVCIHNKIHARTTGLVV